MNGILQIGIGLLPAVAALHERRVGEKNRRVGRRERMEIAMVGTLLAHCLQSEYGIAEYGQGNIAGPPAETGYNVEGQIRDRRSPSD